MLRGKHIVIIAITAATLLSVAACKSSTSPSTPPTCTTRGDCPPPNPITGGGNAILNGLTSSVFNSYVGRIVTPLPNPVQINMNVTANGGVYLGELNIFYYEGTTFRQGHFTNGTSTGSGNNVNVLTVDSATGIPTYRFFFEDPAGVIIVTLQQEGGLPTDSTYGSLSGIVYFRNFNTTAPNPLYQSYTDALGYYWPANPNAFCWSGQITTGPYDCRNMSVQPSTTNGKTVTVLGTFTGLDKKTAFNL